MPALRQATAAASESLPSDMDKTAGRPASSSAKEAMTWGDGVTGVLVPRLMQWVGMRPLYRAGPRESSWGRHGTGPDQRLPYEDACPLAADLRPVKKFLTRLARLFAARRIRYPPLSEHPPGVRLDLTPLSGGPLVAAGLHRLMAGLLRMMPVAQPLQVGQVVVVAAGDVVAFGAGPAAA